MTAAAHRDLESVGPGELERRGHVVGSEASGDQRRPLVEQAVVTAPGLLEGRVVGADQDAPESVGEGLVPVSCDRHVDSFRVDG
jgi:hypothetical protein